MPLDNNLDRLNKVRLNLAANIKIYKVQRPDFSALEYSLQISLNVFRLFKFEGITFKICNKHYFM